MPKDSWIRTRATELMQAEGWGRQKATDAAKEQGLDERLPVVWRFGGQHLVAMASGGRTHLVPRGYGPSKRAAERVVGPLWPSDDDSDGEGDPGLAGVPRRPGRYARSVLDLPAWGPVARCGSGWVCAADRDDEWLIGCEACWVPRMQKSVAGTRSAQVWTGGPFGNVCWCGCDGDVDRGTPFLPGHLDDRVRSLRWQGRVSLIEESGYLGDQVGRAVAVDMAMRGIGPSGRTPWRWERLTGPVAKVVPLIPAGFRGLCRIDRDDLTEEDEDGEPVDVRPEPSHPVWDTLDGRPEVSLGLWAYNHPYDPQDRMYQEHDRRCVDAIVNDGFYWLEEFEYSRDRADALEAVRTYERAVGIVEMHLPERFAGLLPYSDIDNRPALRALFGYGQALLCAGDRAGAAQVAETLVWVSPLWEGGWGLRAEVRAGGTS